MACVVLGHSVLRNVAVPAENPIYIVLGAFEMPLFMFLSGYVLAERIRSPRWKWVADRGIRLMVPFFAWHAIFYWSLRIDSVASGSLLDAASSFGGYIANALAVPAAGLWYLPALFICSALLATIYPLRSRPLLVVLLGYGVLWAVYALRTDAGIAGDWGLTRAFQYWLAFSVGFGWGQLGHGLKMSRPAIAWPLVGFPVAAYFIAPIVAGMDMALRVPAAFAVGLVGIIASTALIAIAEKPARAIRLDALGRLTMGVYCSHWLFLRIQLADGALGVVATFVVALGGSVVLTLLIDRIPYVRGVLLGDWAKRGAKVHAPARV